MKKNIRVALYLRVSTGAQTTQNQLIQLEEVARHKNWEIVHVYQDQGISGTKGRESRPQFDRMLKDAVRGRFDLIASWSVDRLGRSLQDLTGFLNDIHGAGVDLFLHQQALDTSTPSGKALFGMLSIFAEFEAAMIRDRIIAGLERAKRNGKTPGRPRLSGEKVDGIKAGLARGDSVRDICQTIGVGRGSVHRVKQSMIVVE